MNFMFLKRKLIWALVFNLIIVLFEIAAVFFSVEKHGSRVFLFYTQNSNYLALIVSLIFCAGSLVALKKKSTVAYWIAVLRHISTACLTVTICVVLFVLLPMLPSFFNYLILEKASIIQHIIAPILSIVSLLLFENNIKLKKHAILYAVIPTIIYGTVLLTLNFLNIVTGPYPFFYVYLVPWYFSTFCIFGIVIGSAWISFCIYRIFNRKIRVTETPRFAYEK